MARSSLTARNSEAASCHQTVADLIKALEREYTKGNRSSLLWMLLRWLGMLLLSPWLFMGLFGSNRPNPHRYTRDEGIDWVMEKVKRSPLDISPFRHRQAQNAGHALIDALERLRPEEYSDLPDDARRGLYRALGHCADPLSVFYSVPLAVSILRALEHVGDSRMLHALELLEMRSWRTQSGRRLVDAAHAGAEAIRLRIERERRGETLLRPAEAPDVPETLLRPAQGVGETEPDRLLRPAAGDDVTASNSTGSGV